jgi:soluble lytic murein transglycosylase-like protein
VNAFVDLRAVEARIANLAGERAPSRTFDGDPSACASGVGRALGPLVDASARAAGLDPNLARAVIAVESGFEPRAVSAAGAAGLMQLEPETARAYGVSNVFDPAQNLRGGTAYLRDLLARFGGDVPRALAAYNAGPGAVERFGGIPPYPETRAYVARVLAAYNARTGA